MIEGMYSGRPRHQDAVLRNAVHGIAFTERRREPSRIELKNAKDNQDVSLI